MTGIYKIENKINQKVYIGQSYDIKHRWSQHKYHRKTIGRNYIHSAFKKYGIDNFTFEVLVEFDENVDKEILNAAEAFWVKVYNATDRNFGYNIKDPGSNGKHSEETKEKLRQISLGRKLSETAKQKVSEFNKGKKLSQETKDKISKANKGRLKSEIEKQKLSKAFKGKKHSEETKKKIGEANKGKPSVNKGKKHSEETKLKMKNSQKLRRENEKIQKDDL